MAFKKADKTVFLDTLKFQRFPNVKNKRAYYSIDSPFLDFSSSTAGIISLFSSSPNIPFSLACGFKAHIAIFGFEIPNCNFKDFSNFSEEEQLILDFISKDALTMDELILKTNLNIDNLMVILTKLELDGVISQTTGEKYIVAV